MEEISYDDFKEMEKPFDREQVIKDFVLRSLEERPYTCEELENRGKREDVFECPSEDIWVHRCLSNLSSEGVVEERVHDNGETYYGLVKKLKY